MAGIDTIKNVFSGSSGFGENILNYLVILIIILLVVGVGYTIYSFLRYRKIKVIIFSERVGSSTNPANDLRPYREEDRAILLKGKDTWYLWLKKNKVYIQYPPPNSIVPSKGYVAVYLKKLAPDEFYPINVNVDNSNDFAVKIGEGKKLFAAMVWRKMRDSFGEKSLIPKEYIPLIGILLVTVFIIVMFSILMKKFDVLVTVASSLNSAAEAMASAATRCG